MKYTIHESLSPRMAITARPGLGGQWLVEFQRWGRSGKMLDQCAAWLPSGCWDENRWHPIGARLVTPALLEQVESWLRGRPVPEVGL